jgi:hypothetical protein
VFRLINSKFPIWILAGSLFVGLIAFLIPSGFTTAPISPIDELAHIDYVIHLSHGNLPTYSTKYSQTALRISDCLGTNFSKAVGCESKYRNPNLYPPSGWSYEAQQSPLAYVPAALGWHFFKVELKTPQQQVRFLRLANLFWILLSMFFFLSLVKQYKYGNIQILAGAVLLVTNSWVVHSYSYFTNDASLLPMALFSMLALSHSSTLLVKRINLSTKGILLNLILGVILGLTKVVLILVPLTFWIANYSTSKAKRKFEFKNLGAPSIQVITCGISYLLYSQILNYFSQIKAATVFKALLGSWAGTNPLPTLERNLVRFPQLVNSPTNLLESWVVLLFIGLLAISLFTNPKVSNIYFRNLFRAVLVTFAIGSTIFTLELFFAGSYIAGMEYRYLIPLLSVLAISIPSVIAPIFDHKTL